MINRKGIMYGICFFVLFPICFQITASMRLWENNMEETLAGHSSFFLWAVAIGILSALYIIMMMFMYRKLKESCTAGKWIGLVIVLFNIAASLNPVILSKFPMGLEMFYYFFSDIYFYLVIMMGVFIIVDIIKTAIKKEIIETN